MKIESAYKTRPIRFLEIYETLDWKIKLYSISIHKEYVSDKNVLLAKKQIEKWLAKSNLYKLDTYQVATLIIHEGKEGCYAIINWWIGENMLQNFVYLLKNGTTEFELISHNGMNTCVWEMAILWHERNAWIKHILMKNEMPDFEAYLNDCTNQNS